MGRQIKMFVRPNGFQRDPESRTKRYFFAVRNILRGNLAIGQDEEIEPIVLRTTMRISNIKRRKAHARLQQVSFNKLFFRLKPIEVRPGAPCWYSPGDGPITNANLLQQSCHLDQCA